MSTTAAARMPIAIARRVLRRSREIATAIANTASASSARGIDASRRNFTPDWAALSWSLCSSTILPVPGGSVTLPPVRWLSVLEMFPTIGLRSTATVPLAVDSGPDPPFRIRISSPWARRFAARHSSTTRGRARPAATARWM